MVARELHYFKHTATTVYYTQKRTPVYVELGTYQSSCRGKFLLSPLCRYSPDYNCQISLLFSPPPPASFPISLSPFPSLYTYPASSPPCSLLPLRLFFLFAFEWGVDLYFLLGKPVLSKYVPLKPMCMCWIYPLRSKFTRSYLTEQSGGRIPCSCVQSDRFVYL